MKTTKVNQTTKCIPQKGKFWCVPACIENLLRSEGVMDITQEDIIYEYLGSLDPPIMVEDENEEMEIADAPKDQVMQLFREKELYEINFTKLEPIVNDMLRTRSHTARVSYVDGIDKDDYISEVERHLEDDRAVLVSSRSTEGWHITMVYECHDQELFQYDPAAGQHARRQINTYEFSDDVMYCKDE